LDYPAPVREGWGGHKRHPGSLRIRIAWGLFGAFKNACYRNGSSMSEVIRGLIAAYVAADAADERSPGDDER
jgi:hypothetical protein